MEVGGYTLELTCDYYNDEHRYKEFPQIFCGKSRNETMKDAKKIGWTFQKCGYLKCPKCTKKVKDI